jgi:nicotinate-nucleotide adenylyltransferase
VRLGIFGGSFDPPHVGHLLAAHDAVAHAGLDQLVWVPAAQQPLKPGGHAAPAHRLEMVRRMVGDLPQFRVDPVETARPGLSFTVDTLRHFREQAPEASLFLVLGADAVALLPSWREPDTVLALARLVVVSRGQDAAVPPAVDDMARRGAGTPIPLPARRVDVSSTEIRARLAQGLSVRGFVPDAVAAYLAATGLYQHAMDRDATHQP